MGDSEKEILNNTSIDDVTVEELTMKTAKTSKGRKKSEKVGFFASMKAEFKKIIWPNRQLEDRHLQYWSAQLFSDL